MSNENGINNTLNAFTLSLIHDLQDFRENKITISVARQRTHMAREVLRSVSLELEGLRFLGDKAKQISPPIEGQADGE